MVKELSPQFDLANQQRRVEEIQGIITDLERLMSDWEEQTTARIKPENYTALGGLIELEERRKNKLRKTWFTVVLGWIDMACQFLPPATSSDLRHRHLELVPKIRSSVDTDAAMIAATEELARDTITALKQELETLQS